MIVGKPTDRNVVLEREERRLKADEVITGEGEHYPEPNEKALRLSDGSFLVVRNWTNSDRGSIDLPSHLRERLFAGESAPYELNGQHLIVTKKDTVGRKATAVRAALKLPIQSVHPGYYWKYGLFSTVDQARNEGTKRLRTWPDFLLSPSIDSELSSPAKLNCIQLFL